MTEQEQQTASLRASLADRAAENRELRREIARAVRLIEAGRMDAATSLLRFLSLSATDQPA
ncbi:hypothetical protein [Streptomyces capoamus]|uniref:hypothetical protein n=1 Tax=Streptomyces capoamus TaxID=68183 RepID=UPI003399A3DB